MVQYGTVELASEYPPGGRAHRRRVPAVVCRDHLVFPAIVVVVVPVVPQPTASVILPRRRRLNDGASDTVKTECRGEREDADGPPVAAASRRHPSSALTPETSRGCGKMANNNRDRLYVVLSCYFLLGRSVGGAVCLFLPPFLRFYPAAQPKSVSRASRSF